MDILYVVGKGSDWNNNELRYSLRSIAKNGKNIDRVFLVGYKPDFVSDKVIHIPCDNPYNCAHKNILHKVIYAIDHSNIDKHFLISSDDHFYMKKTDFAKLPVYERGILPDKVVGRNLWSPYHRSLKDTRWLLESNGLTIYQTNPHCNTHFDVDVYRENKNIFDECFKYEFGMELNCIMGNLLIAKGVKPVHFEDAKLSNKATEEEIERFATHSGCISTKAEVGGTKLAKFLEKTFNKKCIYES